MINLPDINLVCHTTRDTHKIIAENCPENGIIVECGTYMGRSACYIINSLLELNKTFKYYAVDNFSFDNISDYEKQSQGVLNFKTNREAYENNLRVMGIDKYVTTIESDTLEAIKNFEDNSVYCVYIDDVHNGEWVSKELDGWLPKMIRTGIIIGDDYYCKDIAYAFHQRFGKHVLLTNPNNNNGCIVFLKDFYDR